MQRRPARSTTSAESRTSRRPPDAVTNVTSASETPPPARRRSRSSWRWSGLGPEAHLLGGAGHERLPGMADEPREAVVHVEVAAVVEGADRDGGGAQPEGAREAVLGSAELLLDGPPLADLGAQPLVRGLEVGRALAHPRLEALVGPAQLVFHALALEELGHADREIAAGRLRRRRRRRPRARCSSIRDGGAMTKRQRVPPAARHSVSTATRGTPKLSSHQPEE